MHFSYKLCYMPHPTIRIVTEKLCYPPPLTLVVTNSATPLPLLTVIVTYKLCYTPTPSSSNCHGQTLLQEFTKSPKKGRKSDNVERVRNTDFSKDADISPTAMLDQT